MGISNSGKTSLARALSLILFNTWDKSWVKHGTKFCRVIVQTSTGIEIVREKGEKINRYILKLPDQAEQLFESFGTGVPEAIQQILRIHEVQIDSTDTLNLNLGGQMDALFLLSQTGSYRAKVLGKLSGATYLDFAIRELNKEKRQVTAEKSSKELESAELQVQIDKLISIKVYSDQLLQIETKLASLGIQEGRLERVRSLFDRVKSLKEAWTKETKIEALISQIDTTLVQNLEQRVDKISSISSLYNQFVNLRLVYEKQQKSQELLKQIDLTVVSTFSEKSIHLNKVRELSLKFEKNNKELLNKINELDQTENKYQDTSKQYLDMLKEAKVCPICNRSTIEMEV